MRKVQKRVHLKRGIAILLTALLLAASFGCSFILEEGSRDVETWEPTFYCSDDLYRFEVELNGVTYTLPAAVTEFTANGWKGDYTAAQTLQPNKTADCVFTMDDQQVSVSLINTSLDYQPYEQCYVYKIESRKSYRAQQECRLVLAEGITLGAAYNDVIAAYGEPTTAFSSGRSISYSCQDEASVDFYFDSTTNTVYSITVENKEYKEKLPVSNKELPSVVQDYQAPSELGTSWDTFCVKYAGALYQLPAPVAAFVANGWIMVTDENEEIAAGSEAEAVLRLGNQALTTTLRNYDTKAQPLKNCFVMQIRFGKNNYSGPKIPFELAQGITHKSTAQEIKAAYGKPQNASPSSGFFSRPNYYEYRTTEGYIRIYFEKRTGLIFSIEIFHNPEVSLSNPAAFCMSASS